MAVGPALKLDRITCRFGAAVAVDGVSMGVMPGERRVLLGANGAGKTTLFNVIAGDLRQSAGMITFFGRDISRMPAHRRIRLGMRGTYQTSLTFAGLTVRECLSLALRGVGCGRFALGTPAAGCPEMAEAEAMAHRAGLGGILDTRAGELSHGENRQLEIAMAAAGEPRLLLDEPAAGLSGDGRAALLATLRALPRGVTLIMIEHDVDLALAIADRITVMHNGRLAAEGTPEEMVSNRQVHDICTAGRAY
jgi:branched-chain amino acid transport system ATP-binding protein